MSRPLRNKDPQKIHLLTCRTRHSELLMVPTPKINNCIGGVIARYSTLYGIELYGAIALSNHYHILAKAPLGNMSLFAENINREIAKRVNKIIGRKGSFWGRRYDDQVVIEEVDALEGLLYLLTNPVKHGLVSNPKHWPGFSTFAQAMTGKPQKFTFFNYSEYEKAKSKARLKGLFVRSSDFETVYHLKTTALLPHSKLSSRLQQEKLKELINKRTRRLQGERRKNEQGFLGRKAVLEQPKKGRFPKETNKTPRPACYSKSPTAIAYYREELSILRDMYNKASFLYRLGKKALFPEFHFLPPTHHIPKEPAAIPT